MNLNEEIKSLRKKTGLSQIEFSRRAGVGLRFLRELEQGKMTIRLDKLNQVLEFMGCHLEIAKNYNAGSLIVGNKKSEEKE